ncbi:MAG: hypothetical protein ILO34_08415 [Kiritimatiellae bacterium]|nr:hypothetical protein [Kiritimatiellia bacterium]
MAQNRWVFPCGDAERAERRARFRAAARRERKGSRQTGFASVGDKDGTAAIESDAIFREALKAGADEIVVAHNHPSGDLTPGKADIAATKELKDLARRLGVVFLDHLTISTNGDCVSLEEIL